MQSGAAQGQLSMGQQQSSQAGASMSGQQSGMQQGGQAQQQAAQEEQREERAQAQTGQQQEQDDEQVTIVPTQQSDQQQDAQQQSASQQANLQPLTEDQLIELRGKTVVNSQGEEIGQIDSIVRDRNDQSLKAVIQSGGFFGIGGDKVAVSAQDLQLQDEDQVQLNTQMSKDELQQAASSFEEGDYEAVELQTGQAGQSASQPGASQSASAQQSQSASQ
jgi:sporulation protein YlmC with PRC-barrel domain